VPNPPAFLSAAARRPAIPLVIAVLLTALLASGVAWSMTRQDRAAVGRRTGAGGGLPRVRRSRTSWLPQAEASERDVLVPAASTEIGDGDRIALRRARQITVDVDGKERTEWVTAASVDEALDQLGLRDGNLALSASRSRGIPLEGFRLAVTTPKEISIIADDAVKPLSTTAATVRDALVEAGIRLDRDDRISATRTTPLADRMVIRVTRISTQRATETVAVPFATERREDADLFKGETKTLQAGKAGVIRRVVETVFADGALDKRTVLSSTTVTAPVKRVVAIGTKARPAAPKQSARRASTGGADSLNWPALARCESGGNPRAVSSTGKYRGLYQFSFATWRGVGGSGDPAAASPDEQTYRAKLLYNRSGAGQWPHCGKYLFT
jgi:uncharacterized protein YabE (DUF348 family)